MSESTVPKPPQSSSGALYVIAAIALVAAIGGLVCWKMKGANEGPAPVVIAPPVPTATGLLEPPPPPPPEEPSAAAAESAPARRATVATASCGKCSGTINAALTSAMSARAGSARPCYERALRVNSALQGKLTVSVKVDPQGNVCGASIAQDAIHSPEVSNCVTGMFRSARFPAPSGGSCVELQIPLSFVPREGK
jgi:outer membrane biosynthesis protein TonB